MKIKKQFMIIGIFILIAIVGVVLVLTFFGTKHFTHRNGIRFGMTIDEVKTVEAKNGLTSFEESIETYDEGTICWLWQQENGLFGFDDTTISYRFRKGIDEKESCRLDVIDYLFASDPIYTRDEIANLLIDAATKKYGEPMFNDEKACDYDFMFVYGDISWMDNTSWAAWLIEFDEGYVEINIFNSIQNNGAFLRYHFIDKSIVNSFNQNTIDIENHKKTIQEELDKQV